MANKAQQTAIDSPVNQNVLISAGAGSGKTRTLSDKVFAYIDTNQIKPSELLVLTFTNNAAHEMKTRIIQTFKDNGRYGLANEMASAHVQTFDSFSQYLVSTYSSRLNISDQIAVANQDVINAQKRAILEEIFQEYYNNPLKCERLLKTLKKYNMVDDSSTKDVILDLDIKLDGLLPSKKLDFMNNYETKFLSKEAFNRYIDIIVNWCKSVIKTRLIECGFLEKHYDTLEIDINSMGVEKFNVLKNIFKDKKNFDIDYRYLVFSNNEYTQETYLEIKQTLDLDGEEFIKAAYELMTDKNKLKTSTSIKKFNDDVKEKDINDYMRQLFKSEKRELKYLGRIPTDLTEAYEQIVSSKEDIELFFEIIQELDKRLDDYKATTNCFTFSDISKKALALLTEEKYADIAEEIRCRFKYIMVDEYQDTNDFQELFLDSLLKENKQGERAHLFCVGDAKQSIYGFRNSNVQLFRNRQALYSVKTPEHEVIAMNMNYRSAPKLLDDINYIFGYYMTLEHGSIDYSDPMERLDYDDKVDLFHDKTLSKEERNKYFGIKRITSTSGFNNDLYKDGSKKWEALAIAHDIKQKVESGFLIYQKGKDKNEHPFKPRPCKYSDFAILVRKKKDAAELYQQIFQENDIKLNSNISTDLKEIDAIILIQSLVNLISSKINHTSCDERHLFMSIARSYVYQYDDQKLFDILTSDPSIMENDPIMEEIHSFVKRNKKSTFSALFTDMINTFHIVDKLYLIGNVSDNIAKIESLYQIVLSQETSGEGIKEFVELYKNISKYDLTFTSDSVTQIEDAVDLMTIHASKGLERKIVYMPASFNNLGSPLAGADYIFSIENGVILPNYCYDPDNKVKIDETKDGEEVWKTKSFPTYPLASFANEISNNDEERHEHVRLFYVALTRAENLLYIVGDLKDETHKTEVKNINDETLYGMLSYLPHYLKLNDAYIKQKIKEGIVEQSQYDLYLSLVKFMKELSKEFNSDDLTKEEYTNYLSLWEKYYYQKLFDDLDISISSIKNTIFQSYYRNFMDNHLYDNQDIIARLFSIYKFKVDNKSYQELQDYIKGLTNQSLNENEEGNENDNDDSIITLDELPELLAAFKKAISVDPPDFTYFLSSQDAVKAATKEYELYKIPYCLVPYLLSGFALIFDNEPFLYRVSYENQKVNFIDEVTTFDYHDMVRNHTNKNNQKVELTTNNETIAFNTRVHKHASKNRVISEEEVPAYILERGTYLHRLMELVDLESKDTSFIKNERDRKLISEVLKLEIFDDMDNKTVYKEYGYFDPDLDTTGFIDLMYIYKGEYYIIDYKSKHVADDDYENQLHTYQRNIQRIFHINDSSKIHLYLLSLSDKKLLEVVPE